MRTSRNYFKKFKKHRMNSVPFYRRNPRLYFLIIAAAITALLWHFAGKILSPYPCWLVCINFVTFLFYGYDKWQSMIDGWRVPEAVLHLLSIAGGFIGAFIGRIFFRHKTQKLFFIIIIIFAALLHIALFLYF